MTDLDYVDALRITPAGEVDVVKLEVKDGVTLDAMYREIGCSTVDVVELTGRLDMWLDDEGLLVGAPINVVATMLAGDFGRSAQVYVGTVLLASHDGEGNTVSLDGALLQRVRELAGE